MALLILYLSCFIVSAFFILFSGTPFENTLNLAATGRIDFNAAWFYRFRNPNNLMHGGWNFALPVFFFLVKYTGTRLFWSMILLLQAFILIKAPSALKILSLPLIATGILFGETAILWNTVFFLLCYTVSIARKNPKAVLVPAFASVFFSLLGLGLASPLDHVRRQNVLGGKSVIDTLRPQNGGHKAAIRENCVAAVNPDDFRAVSSLELLDPASFRGFSETKIIDLKIAEMNYRLLSLRDEKGKFIFSAQARDFAAAEALYADPIVESIRRVPVLCLVANFDTLPQNETAPYSRARRIIDLRKKNLLETRVIQLPSL